MTGGLLIAAAVLSTACGGKKSDDDRLAEVRKLTIPKSPVAEPARVEPALPIEPKRADPTPTIDVAKLAIPTSGDVMELLNTVRATVAAAAPDIGLSRVRASYVRTDGTLDPRYGTLELQFARSNRPELVDDPNRPTGAPIPTAPKPVERATERCPTVTFGGGTWKSVDATCRKRTLLTSVRCSAADIWKRARQRRAPDNAVAIMTLYKLGFGIATWSFTIKDSVRRVNFDHYFDDDCEPAAGHTTKPSPKSP